MIAAVSLWLLYLIFLQVLSRMSRGLLILVDEPAEAVVSLDLVDLGWCATGEWSCGSGLAQSAVRPMSSLYERMRAIRP